MDRYFVYHVFVKYIYCSICHSVYSSVCLSECPCVLCVNVCVYVVYILCIWFVCCVSCVCMLCLYMVYVHYVSCVYYCILFSILSICPSLRPTIHPSIPIILCCIPMYLCIVCILCMNTLYASTIIDKIFEKKSSFM